MTDDVAPVPVEVPESLDFWSFIELANRRLSTEYGSTHELATQVLLTLNRASNVVTYDLESSIHRRAGCRGRRSG